MGRIFSEIKEQTKTMDTKGKIEYILTYYWYHLLGLGVIFGLVIFLILHFAFPEKKPLFTCVMVNQKIDYDRDEEVAKAFAKNSGISEDQVVFDSDYIISYKEENKKEGTNESSFDKFFFKWSGGELDAVVMDKDFLKYCIEVGGEFYPAGEFDTGDLSLCEIEGVSAIELKDTGFGEELTGEKDLVVVFPKTGEHRDNCQKFVDYLKEN